MEPTIKHIDSFSVLGIQTRVKQGSETPDLFEGIWAGFEVHQEYISAVSTRRKYYGINFPTESEDVSSYLAGMAVADDTPASEGLVKRKVPGGAYAIFECPVEGIGECYQGIFTKWLPLANAPFNPTNPVFEEYPEEDSGLPVRIYIPVTKPD
jgi:predicted transcriptional regulator YdeE